MPDLTVTIEGKEHTVDASTVKFPEGHRMISEDALRTDYVQRTKVDSDYVPKASVEEKIKGRVKNLVNKADAAKDPDVVSAVLAEHKGKEINLADEKASWKKSELDPVATERDSLLRRAKGALINASALKAGADKKFTQPIAEGKPSYMELAYGENFEYDAALDDFVAVKAGHRVGADPDSGRQFANADEFFAREAKGDRFKEFLAPKDRNDQGSGFGTQRPGEQGNAGSGGTGKYPGVGASVQEKADYYASQAGKS